jgi:hypothetical protein
VPGYGIIDCTEFGFYNSPADCEAACN